MSYEAVVPSNRRTKDREADHQRWADRQEVTADVLRETVEAAGARAAEISEWLDSSFLPDDPDSVFGAVPKPSPHVDPVLSRRSAASAQVPAAEGLDTLPSPSLRSADKA